MESRFKSAPFPHNFTDSYFFRMGIHILLDRNSKVIIFFFQNYHCIFAYVECYKLMHQLRATSFGISRKHIRPMIFATRMDTLTFDLFIFNRTIQCHRNNNNGLKVSCTEKSTRKPVVNFNGA